MGAGVILGQQVDVRKGGKDCRFNGYLEDFMHIENELDHVLKDAFTAIVEKDNEVRICVDLKGSVSEKAISNQIIRYKDIFKVYDKAMAYPYILYKITERGERALLVVPAEPYSYIYAKGFYYCMTESESPFSDCRNEIVAVSFDQAEPIINAWESIFRTPAGALQRASDGRFYRNYDELKEQALAASDGLRAAAQKQLVELEDRTDAIYSFVVKWFLLKKVLYVQYMVNKSILSRVHEGNVKKQRNQAKKNADEIVFMSYSEMWRFTKNEE